jgi:2-oxoglutarate ferredoxin oxidoreductase subunit beta
MGARELRRYLRVERSSFCPGCGCGQVLANFLRAIDELKTDPDTLALVSGIGCSGWIPNPSIAADAIHTPHGRAIVVATGIKLFNPKLKVVVFTGDGDLAAIGGNHFIHACRRDLDITVICINNSIFAMTGGQVAPTSGEGVITPTTPYGNREKPFDLCQLALGAGAGMVARCSTGHPQRMVDVFCKSLEHEGFSFVEVLSQCPTHSKRDPYDELRDLMRVKEFYRLR